MGFLSYLPAWFDPILPPNLEDRPKIFGIGFHKTGTTSLGRALRTLRFRLHKSFEVMAYFKGRPTDLLCWDLEAEPGWGKLRRCLALAAPAHDFPHGKRQAWT